MRKKVTYSQIKVYKYANVVLFRFILSNRTTGLIQ